MDIRQPEVASLVAIGQAFVVKSHAMQDRCIDVVHVDRAAGNVVTTLAHIAPPDASTDVKDDCTGHCADHPSEYPGSDEKWLRP